MQTKDYLMIAVGLGLAACLIRIWWIKHRVWLTRKLGEYSGAGNSAKAENWRWFLIMSCLIVPTVCELVNHFLVGYSYGRYSYLSDLILQTVGSIPISAGIIYVAWRSPCQDRWVRVAKFWIFILLGSAFSFYVQLILSGDSFGTIFGWFDTASGVIDLTMVAILVTAARALRMHLIRDEEVPIEPDGITIRFLLVMQAFLGVLFLATPLLRMVNHYYGLTYSPMHPVISTLLSCITFTFATFSIFFPNRPNDLWIAIPLLVVALLGLNLNFYLENREQAIQEGTLEDLASIIQYLFFWDYFLIGLIAWVTCLVPIRIFFQMAGLKLARATKR